MSSTNSDDVQEVKVTDTDPIDTKTEPVTDPDTFDDTVTESVTDTFDDTASVTTTTTNKTKKTKNKDKRSKKELRYDKYKETDQATIEMKEELTVLNEDIKEMSREF